MAPLEASLELPLEATEPLMKCGARQQEPSAKAELLKTAHNRDDFVAGRSPGLQHVLQVLVDMWSLHGNDSKPVHPWHHH